MKKTGLTAKQRCFVEEYLVDLSAAQAAERAGYEFATNPSGFYTYLLADPRTGGVFYIGKGKGRRIGEHVRRALAGKVENAEKHKRIAGIHEAGFQVSEILFALHESEAEAFSVERLLIDALRESGITNIVGGVVTNEELERQQARAALDRMRSFDEWVAHAKPHQIESAKKLRGSAKACYDAIRNELRMIAEPC